jgi:hypothetical protein
MSHTLPANRSNDVYRSEIHFETQLCDPRSWENKDDMVPQTRVPNYRSCSALKGAVRSLIYRFWAFNILCDIWGCHEYPAVWQKLTWRHIPDGGKLQSTYVFKIINKYSLCSLCAILKKRTRAMRGGGGLTLRSVFIYNFPRDGRPEKIKVVIRKRKYSQITFRRSDFKQIMFRAYFTLFNNAFPGGGGR